MVPSSAGGGVMVSDKLFTANVSSIALEVGTLTPPSFERVLKAVAGLLQPNG